MVKVYSCYEILYNIYMTTIALSNELQSLLDNRLRYLPPLAGQAIMSIDWSSKLIDIGRSFGLHIDEMEDFQAVVLKALTGLIAPAAFEQELIAALALSPANAEKVIAAVNAQVFEPIHDFVMRGGKSAPINPLAQAGIHVEGVGREAGLGTGVQQPSLTPVASIEFGSGGEVHPAEPATEPAIEPSPAEVHMEDFFK